MLFRKLLLTVGPGFALGTALLAAGLHRPAPQALAWALLGALTQITLAVALALGLFRLLPGRWFTVLLLYPLQLAGASAGFLGLMFLIARWPDSRGVWQRLQPPLAPPIRLETPVCVDGGPPWVVAIDATGARYRLTGTSTSDPWILESNPPVAQPGGRPCTDRRDRADWLPRPRLKSELLETHLVALDGVDCGGQAAYALTADGTVWSWSVYDCSIGVFAGFVAGLVWNGLLGLAAAAVAIRSDQGRAWRSLQTPVA